MNNKIYLKKAGDENRKPMPFAAWVLIVALMVAGAWGFSCVLSGWAIPNASETTQKYGAFGIAFTLSVVLVFLTHIAGHAVHRNREVKHALRLWEQDTKPVPLSSIKEIGLDDDQAQDDHMPAYVQKIARVGMNTSWTFPVITVWLLMSMAVAAQYIHAKTLELQEVLQINAGMPFGLFIAALVLPNALSFLCGMKYGFIGKESQRAYAEAGRLR